MDVFSHESFSIAVTAVTHLRDCWADRSALRMNGLFPYKPLPHSVP